MSWPVLRSPFAFAARTSQWRPAPQFRARSKEKRTASDDGCGGCRATPWSMSSAERETGGNSHDHSSPFDLNRALRALRQLRVVCHQHERRARRGIQMEQQIDDVMTCFRVKIAGRFVGKQYFRPIDKSA